MKMGDIANFLPMLDHKGPHPDEYHEAVMEALERATSKKRNAEKIATALKAELRLIGKSINNGGEFWRLLNRR
jgi:2-keto-3-deoxy-L-rhamnonate aldolase RhmA